MLPKQINFILKICDFLGFYTESSPKNCKPVFNYVFRMLSVIYFAYQLFKYHSLLEWYLDKALDVLNVVMQSYGTLLTYCVIIVDSLIHRRTHQNFWMISEKSYKLRGDQQQCLWWNFVFKFTEFHSTAFLITLVNLIHFKSHAFNLFFIIILFKICHSRIFHYLLYLEIIQIKLKIIQIECKASILIGTAKESTKIIRELYQMILEMVENLNDIFGYSHLVTVLYCFYFVLTDLNWAYVYFSKRLVKYIREKLFFQSVILNEFSL